jgi:hypothetical protein
MQSPATTSSALAIPFKSPPQAQLPGVSQVCKMLGRTETSSKLLSLGFSQSSFTRALGAQGEAMFDAALPTVGFMPTGWNVRSYGGLEWAKTGHDFGPGF